MPIKNLIDGLLNTMAELHLTLRMTNVLSLKGSFNLEVNSGGLGNQGTVISV